MEHEDKEFAAPLKKDADGPIVVMEATLMCGTGAQFKVRSYGDSSDPLPVLHGLADKLMRIGLRRQAIAELPDLVTAVEKAESVFAERAAAEEIAKSLRAEGLEERRRKVKAADDAAQGFAKARELEWKQRGRQGAYIASKADESARHQLIQAAITVSEELKNAEQQADAEVAQFEANTRLWQDEIAKAKEKLATAQALIAEGGSA